MKIIRWTFWTSEVIIEYIYFGHFGSLKIIIARQNIIIIIIAPITRINDKRKEELTRKSKEATRPISPFGFCRHGEAFKICFSRKTTSRHHRNF